MRKNEMINMNYIYAEKEDIILGDSDIEAYSVI